MVSGQIGNINILHGIFRKINHCINTLSNDSPNVLIYVTGVRLRLFTFISLGTVSFELFLNLKVFLTWLNK